jgi:hypothetical protein
MTAQIQSRTDGPVEPSAQMRAFARTVREIHVAFVEAGFSDEVSQRLVGVVLVASRGGRDD